MSQRKYIEDVLIRFGMENSKSVTTPLDNSIKLSKKMEPITKEEISEMKMIPYQSLIGSLMYLAVSTRPDIAYSVYFLSQYNTNPGKAHWMAAKRILRYLRGTTNHGLVYQKTENPLIGFVDSDWGASLDDRISYTGFVFKLADAAITWESKKQRTVALSSTEAEYLALGEATKEAVYLRNLLQEIGYMHLKCEPTVLFCDNQGAQNLTKNPVFHCRTKHIDIRHHYIREIFRKGQIDVKYIPTDDMVADVLTKGLYRPKHEKFRKYLGISDVTTH